MDSSIAGVEDSEVVWQNTTDGKVAQSGCASPLSLAATTYVRLPD